MNTSFACSKKVLPRRHGSTELLAYRSIAPSKLNFVFFCASVPLWQKSIHAVNSKQSLQSVATKKLQRSFLQ
jgi:hypothetical protein